VGKVVEESDERMKSLRGRDERERERAREVKFGKVGERGRGINSKHDMQTLKKVTQQSQLSTAQYKPCLEYTISSVKIMF